MFEESDAEWLAAQRDDQEVLSKKAVHFLALGVLAEYEGKGIAQALIHATISYLKAKGYSLVYSSAAALATQKIYSKLGFKKVVEKRHSDFTFNGERVFKDITELESLIVFEKHI